MYLQHLGPCAATWPLWGVQGWSPQATCVRRQIASDRARSACALFPPLERAPSTLADGTGAEVRLWCLGSCIAAWPIFGCAGLVAGSHARSPGARGSPSLAPPTHTHTHTQGKSHARAHARTRAPAGCIMGPTCTTAAATAAVGAAAAEAQCSTGYFTDQK